MTKFRPVVIGSLMLVAVASSIGQANQIIPVVEASPGISRQVTAAQNNIPTAQANAPAAAGSSLSAANGGAQGMQIYYQLESLQQEVQQLRGIVEQQEYQMKRMREEQRDRYLDLDRRITLLNQAGSKPVSGVSQNTVDKPAAQVKRQPTAVSAPQPAPVATAPVKPKAVIDEAAESKAYQAAFSLVRNKQYAQAAAAFRQQIKTYPDGNYTGNAYYWLGEVLIVESEHEQALTAFGALLSHYPEHRKAPDAKYKQGKIYLQMGEKARAKELLQSVIDQHAGTSAAKLAEADMRDASL